MQYNTWRGRGDCSVLSCVRIFWKSIFYIEKMIFTYEICWTTSIWQAVLRFFGQVEMLTFKFIECSSEQLLILFKAVIRIYIYRSNMRNQKVNEQLHNS